jgi:uncharacterized repeat protein (TIGR03803 family)
LMVASHVAIRAADAGYSIQLLRGFGSNPKNPQARLLQAKDGRFYGTTEFGGTNGENGTVFRITPNGDFTAIFSFGGMNGSRPVAGLIQGTDGHLYGTTAFGGTNGDQGTVFRITTNGVFTSLHSFGGTDGSSPQAPLVQGTDGNLYGSTAFGGGSADNGSFFRITTGGVFTHLFALPSNGRSGKSPMGGLVQGGDGNFYGTTALGGTGSDDGTVFRLTSSGGFSSLFSFNGANGSGPAAGLILGTDASLYGTTEFGGANNDNGTVFKITQAGAFTLLHSFRGVDGNYPVAELEVGGDGNFYGTTSGDRAFGGTNTFGTIFRITPTGVLTTLNVFGGTNGASPVAALSYGSDGNFYGSTFEGGPGSGGTIFRIVETPVIDLITSLNGIVTVRWSSFSQGSYRVEFKTSVNAPSWTALFPDVVATTTRTSITNAVGGATQRFYRVRLLP